MDGDAIFLVRGDGLVEMNESEYDLEELLQDLLERFPRLLSGSQIDPDSPRRWLLVQRETGVPRTEGGGDHWQLDHLFLDQDAIPTLVEVKRSSNREIRRMVVGQMLDYAANASRYWPIDGLIARYEETCEAKGLDPLEELRTLLGEEADTDTFWSRVEENLRTGRIRLIFAADRIPPELQAIIEFLNEQMERTEVLGVEVRQYVGEGQQTPVPRVIGQTAAARTTKETGDPRTFEQRLAESTEATREVERRLVELAAQLGLAVGATAAARQIRAKWGTALQVYPQAGSVDANLDRLRKAGLVEEADALWRQLGAMTNKPLTTKYPSAPTEELLERWESFVTEFVPAYLEAHSRV